MEPSPSPSPLTRQTRPDYFQPKIVELYKHLFSIHNHGPISEGFWTEFFLLSPDKGQFRNVLDPLTADDLLHIQAQTQTFFSRATEEVGKGTSPRTQNALENLTAFLGGVLSKKYTNPSSDVIQVLAGLDQADKLVSDLVISIDDLARNGSDPQLRAKVIDVALALTAGAYQTGLVSYLTHRDLFPALMKYVREGENSSDCFEPLLLLGLLANYNKFEFQNPYQNRLEDFVNERTIESLVAGIGHACETARDGYLAIYDDMPDGWNLSSALVFVGLRALTPEGRVKKALPSEEEAKGLFDACPPAEASLLLSTYSFVHANKLFASDLVSQSRQNSGEAPFALLLSLSSYLSHHAYRSRRGLHYAILSMLTLQTIVEDPILIKRLSSDELKTSVRLCRQRPPHPPLITSDRLPASVILDICTDTISHNLRRRLDIPLHTLALGIILRITTYFSRNKLRLSYHWTYLWGALLSFLRFLTQYAADLTQLPNICKEICTPLTDLIAFCLSAGDTFLPDPSSYDDLFYKLIETGSDLLARFRDVYYRPKASSKPNTPTSPPPSATSAKTASQLSDSSINILISVCSHYHSLLLQAQNGGKKVHQSPTAVQKVIKQGYDTLSIEPRHDLGSWDKWREGQGSWKAELKRIVRTVVDDAKRIVER